jgi:RNA polymerase sigma factor (sigma-70 family)
MAEAHLNPLLHHIRHLIGSVPAAALTDSQLLERFLACRDESAVEVLVRRHGPLVFGVCRRVLRDAHAAEDAFQATFLVLTRKAPSLVRHERLGSWLYKVAYRLALRARATLIRRQQCEAQVARGRPDSAGQHTGPSDLIVALDEEIQRLPASQRMPLVLCYFEGKTNEQAAEILGCPRGSMSARLAQARARIQVCLARRGFAAPAAGIAGLLAACAAEATVPIPLLTNTVRAAVWFAGEQASIASAASPQAVALAKGAFRAMFLNRLQIAAAGLLAAMLLGTGATLLVQAASEASPQAQAAPQQPSEVRTAGAAVADDPLPKGAIGRMGSRLLRHGDAVSFAAYTPDGKALLTAGRDKVVRLWDLDTGKAARSFRWEETEQVQDDDAGLQRERQFWNDTARSCQAALSMDGKIVAASRGGAVRLWETASGKTLGQVQTGEKRLLQLAFAADGKSLLTLGPGQATALWDVATRKCVRSSPGKATPLFFAPLGLIETHNVVVSPGLKHLAYCGQDNNGSHWIHIRDLANGNELSRISVGPGTMAMTFSADDKTLILENPGAGIVFADVATGRERRRLKSDGHNDSPNSEDSALAIAMSPDGNRLAVSWMSNTIELWDLASGKSTLPVGKVASAEYDQHSTNWLNLLVRPALAFSPDGKKLVYSLGGAAIRQFQADSGVAIPDTGTGHRGPVSALSLSSDGRTLWTYSPGDPARSWDWMTGKETGQREVPPGATQAAFAADGRFACVAGHGFTLSGVNGKQATIAAGPSLPESVALSPDGELLATRNFLRAEVHLWDATTRKEKIMLAQADAGQGAGGPATEAAGVLPQDLMFSPDGRYLATAGRSRQLCLWDVATAALFWELPLQAGQAIERFAFSSNGRVLATLQADRTVTLYEVVSGAKRARLGEADPKHRRVYFTDGSNSPLHSVQMRRDAPVCLAFSPDGRYLATAQETSEIRVWDIRAGRELARLAGHAGGVVSLLFTPDGKHLFSGGTDTTVLTWDLTRLPRSEAPRAAELTPQALDGLWTDLASTDAARAFAAIRKLSANPSKAIVLLKDRVRPARPADPQRLARLLGDLENERFEVRRQAQTELEALGELAEGALRKALAGDPPLALRQRIERLLDKLSTQVPGAEQLRELRALETLELLGNPEARQLLQTLAAGAPEARLTREASNALRRLRSGAETSAPEPRTK